MAPQPPTTSKCSLTCMLLVGGETGVPGGNHPDTGRNILCVTATVRTVCLEHHGEVHLLQERGPLQQKHLQHLSCDGKRKALKLNFANPSIKPQTRFTLNTAGPPFQNPHMKSAASEPGFIRKSCKQKLRVHTETHCSHEPSRDAFRESKATASSPQHLCLGL
ncbi:hypothetical protein WMY93_033701 [Mugilogobius chulae]|uniref:Uncharacterized protein n=1 Tax=Mugilogobius chulae TaxID=88201 RepID=A0AAW0MM45_9GOBI